MKNEHIIFSISLVLLIGGPTTSAQPFPGDRIDGYWVGDLPTGPDLLFVWHFETMETGLVDGTSFIVSKKTSFEKSDVAGLSCEGDKISFSLVKYRSRFEGTVDLEKGTLTGLLKIPNSRSSKVELSLKKTAEEDVPLIEKISKTRAPFRLDQLYARDALLEDLAFLQKSLEENHPKLYAFQPKETFERRFREAREGIQDKMTSLAFQRIMIPLVAGIGCSHTRVIHPMAFMDVFMSEGESIPLRIRFVGDQAYAIQNLVSRFDVPSGSEVISINGKAMAEIRQELLRFISADRCNETQKMMRINHQFWLMYNYIETPDAFRVEFIPPGGGKKQTVPLPAMKNMGIAMPFGFGPPGAGRSPLQVEYKNGSSIAVLKVTSFEHADFGVFKARMSRIFDELKEKSVAHLIIDLRGNTGGHPRLSSELLKFVADKPVTYFHGKAGSGLPSDLYKPLDPHESRFTGKKYFLIDGGCISSTGHLLSLVKYHDLGTLIGEEAGGSFTCNDNHVLLKLPNTGLDVMIARSTYQTAVDRFAPDDPIMPHFEVNPTLDDILEGEDAVMRFALALIEQGGS